MVARYWEYNKIDTTFIAQYKQVGYNLKVKREKSDGENKLDEKEEKGYMTLEELKAVADNINYDEIKTKRQHMKYLLLKLLIYNPLRTNYYYTAEFSTGKTEDKKNYLVFLKLLDKRRAILHVGKDKVTNTKSFKDEEKKNIEIRDKEIIDLLYDSYEKYPRKYLIETDKNKQGNQKTITTYLQEITNNKFITIDMIRASFITYHYDNSNLNHTQKQELAERLRHSINIASMRYYKQLALKNKPTEILENEINELKAENNTLKVKLQEMAEKLQKYENIFEDAKNKKSQKINDNTLKNDEKLFRKRRLDYIYKLNNNKTKKANEKLMEFYNVRYDDEKKYYY